MLEVGQNRRKNLEEKMGRKTEGIAGWEQKDKERGTRYKGKHFW